MKPDKISITTQRFPQITASIFGNAPEAVLLLHGFPASGNLWREIVPALAQDFTVIVPDLPGVGMSILGSREVSIAQLASAMLELLDYLKVEKTLVAGHSMGGYIALAMAANAPDRLSGLSLVHSTAMPDDDEKKSSRRKAIALIEKGGKEAFINASVTSLFAPAFKEQHPQVIAQQISEGIAVPDETLIAFYNAMIERPSTLDILHKVDFPVQWIIGEQDSVIPKAKGIQQSSVARVSFVSVYENCGHMSMLEDPGTLTKDLKEFIVYSHGRTAKELVR